MRPRPPARLYVHLAITAPRGVILRRGPSRWTRMILWNTELFDVDGRDLPGVSWADLDQQGRVVYARDGKLFAEGDRELADFNPMTPQPDPPT